MANLAVNGENSGEVAKAEIVTRVLLGAAQAAPKAVDPTVSQHPDRQSTIVRHFPDSV
jgi:hypothetical protein